MDFGISVCHLLHLPKGQSAVLIPRAEELAILLQVSNHLIAKLTLLLAGASGIVAVGFVGIFGSILIR